MTSLDLGRRQGRCLGIFAVAAWLRQDRADRAALLAAARALRRLGRACRPDEQECRR